MIDTHVHLNLDDYTDLGGAIARAVEVGVDQFVVPGLDLASSQKALEMSWQYPQTVAAIGLHPMSADEELEPFRELARDPHTTAIGEVGTDAKAGDWANQEKRLRFFLELAIEVNKPVLLHVRDTWDPTFAILRDYPQLRGKAVIHCFTGGQAEAAQIRELGLLISVTAILARPALADTCAVVKDWPLDQLMLETDGPYLMWPGEKWPNEPKTVAKIAGLVAQIKEVSVEEVAQQTTQTAKRFFNL
jgi:TatD DNase family protein